MKYVPDANPADCSVTAAVHNNQSLNANKHQLRQNNNNI